MRLYIVTLEEMKREVGLEDEEDDRTLTLWMEGLQERIDNFLNRTLLRAAAATEYHDGGERFIYTKHWPVESVASIDIARDKDWANGTTLDADATDYLVNEARGKISYGMGTNLWPAGFQSIRTILAGGFVASEDTPGSGQTAMPGWARRSMVIQAGFEYRNKGDMGITQTNANGATKQIGAGVALSLKGKTLLGEVEQTLQPHRRIFSF